jgi:MFS family permease
MPPPTRLIHGAAGVRIHRSTFLGRRLGAVRRRLGGGRRLDPQRKLVVGAIFAAAAGTFLVVPFLALQLAAAHLSASVIGLLLSISVLTSRALPLVTGVVADVVGARATMAAGIASLGAAYAGLGLTRSPAADAGLLVVMGVGVALFQPSSKSLLVDGVADEEVGIVFAWRNLAFNAGAALGSAAGSLALVAVSYSDLFVAAGVAYLVLLVLFLLVGVPDAGGGGGAARPSLADFAASLADGRLVRVTLVSAGFWMLYAQLNLTLPLALQRAGHARLIGVLFAINACVIIVSQLPLARVTGGTPIRRRIGGGLLLVGLGLASLALLPHAWAALPLFVILFSLGEMTVAPTLDTATSLLAPAGRAGTYFGIASLGFALGGVGGNILGGVLADALRPSAFWLVCCLFALVLAAAAARQLQGLPAEPTGRSVDAREAEPNEA